MPDWEEDSPTLRRNLEAVLAAIETRTYSARPLPSFEDARLWHIHAMNGLIADKPEYIGRFRGEAGLEGLWVAVEHNLGTPPEGVSANLLEFEDQLRQKVVEWDAVVPIGGKPDARQLNGVIELCAWAHAEWVRIHPFVNGNGRTARLWANSLAMRYGLPPFIRLRPRPNHGYNNAGEAAMRGGWTATAEVFERLLMQYVEEEVGPLGRE